MISWFGLTGLLSLFVFYMSHTADYVTTIWGLRNTPEVYEANPVFSWAQGNPWKIGVIKYTLATMILLVIFLVPSVSLAILGDTLFEVGITTNNIYQMKIARWQ